MYTNSVLFSSTILILDIFLRPDVFFNKNKSNISLNVRGTIKKVAFI